MLRVGFLVVWEFLVRPGLEARFESVYSSSGVWAQLFAGDPNFVRTELQRDLRQPGRYLTFDLWSSEAAYDAFMQRHENEYRIIDKECEGMTESEKLIGRFAPVA
jgi:quinol monooxygenase YgiN